MKARRVLIINPPLWIDPEFIDYPYFAILGALSNAAALREKGFSVTVADAQSTPLKAGSLEKPCRGQVGCGINRLLESVSGNFDAIVISMPPYLKPYARTPFTARLFSAARARFPKARLAAADCYFGGMHYIEYDGEDFLRRFPDVDAVVKYEGEEEIAAWLKSPAAIAPRVARGRAAEIHPDDLPFPAWDLIPLEGYYDFLRRFFDEHGRASLFGRDLPTLPALTSRGCAYRCAFCTANPGEPRPVFRPHGLPYLRRYFYTLKTRFGARRLALLDGCANHEPERFAGILDILRKLELSCEFPNGLRADRLTFGMLKKLKALSESLTISAESGDPETLARIHKGMDVGAVARVAAWCRQLHFPLNIHYIIGCPDETLESVNRTFAHALKMREMFGARPLVQNFVPIPGTPWHSLCVERKLLRHFDVKNLCRHFQNSPAIGTPQLTRGQVERMAELFRRRLEAASLEKVIMNLTYQCQNNCRFCAVGDRRRRHGNFKRYCRMLRDYSARGIVAVDFDGGEPTLYPRLFPLIRLAGNLGYKNITVTTNGRRLADRSYAARFLLSGISNLLVSLHGHRPEIHEHHTRRRGSFRETVAGLRHALRLKPRRISLGVNTTITARNAPHLEEFFRFVRGLGVKKVNIQFVTPFGHAVRAAQNRNVLWPQIAPAIRRWQGRLQIQVINAIPCQASRHFLTSQPEVGKHSREMVFVDASPRNLAAYLDAKREKTAACRACEFSIGCSGFYVFEGRSA